MKTAQKREARCHVALYVTLDVVHQLDALGERADIRRSKAGALAVVIGLDAIKRDPSLLVAKLTGASVRPSEPAAMLTGLALGAKLDTSLEAAENALDGDLVELLDQAVAS